MPVWRGGGRGGGFFKAPIWPWLLAAGAGLACGYLNREDAGLFLLPFAIAATLCMLVVLLHRRRWLCAAAQVIPYAVLAAGVGIFCALNQHWYGVWGLSDFSEGSFADAMGAMTRVATDSDEPLLSVPADAREKLYAEIPQLQCLQYWLGGGPHPPRIRPSILNRMLPRSLIGGNICTFVQYLINNL